MTYDDETPLDVLRERLYDAIETAMWAHESLNGDSVCTCGVVNNMDGDVLPGHRVGAVASAAWSVIEALGLVEDVDDFMAYDFGTSRRLVTKWERNP